MDLQRVFSESIYPNFPFRMKGWHGMAFDRDLYNSRMPEWFFRTVSEVFGSRDQTFQIFTMNSLPLVGFSCNSIQFEWSAYYDFITAPENYSPEYKMHGKRLEWACWANAELTVWGGSSPLMENVYANLGGTQGVLKFMMDEMTVDERRHAELYSYLKKLTVGID